MKALVLNTSYSPPAGKEYDPGLYPCDGLYIQGENLFIRSTLPTPGAVPYVTGFTGAARLLTETAVSSRIDTPGEPFEVRGVSEDFVLKAMAIAQNPSLAEKLIK